MTPTNHDAHGRTWAAGNGAAGAIQSSTIVSRPAPTGKTQFGKLAMQQEALHYATNYGWQVLPVRGKEPATDHGHKDASSDPEEIGALFAAADRVTGVGARMGARLAGKPIIAPEIDPKNGGTVESFYKLTGVRMGEYKTPTMRTGGGGWAMIVYVPDDEAADYGDLHIAKGIEIQGSRKMRILPPSVHPDKGKRYQWVPGLEPWSVDVAPVPALLLDRIRAKTRHKAQDGRTAAHSGQAGQYDAATVKAMLDVLDPWQDGYDWWLSILMAVHSALGDDGLALAEDWGDGKPGEIAKKFASFDAAGDVGIGTLIFHAKAAGWLPPARPEPEEWRITPDDVQACPLCGTFFHTPTADGRTVTVALTCGNKNCPGERKHRAKMHFGRVLDWDTAYLAVVEDGNPWRTHTRTAKMAGGDWVGITLGGMVLSVTTCPTAGAELVPISEAVQQLTDAIAAMPAGKRIRQPHGMGPRARTRRALTPELRRLRYKIPKEDMPLLQDAYRETGVDFTMRRGRLVSCDPLTAEQVQALGDRLATIAETRRGWRCLAQPMRRLRALQVGTFPTPLFHVPIRNGHDPVELSTYRQHGLFLPSEVPIPPP